MSERNTNRTNETLQAAILSAFTVASNAEVAERLGRFRARDWRGLGTWLDASGLALYFLEAIRVRGLFEVVPGSMVEGLQQNQLDNRDRTDSLMDEFIRLNTAFRNEGLDFLNVKGFSLGTEYCANPALRSQFDLDFWCSEDAAVQCKTLMRRLGYAMVAASSGILELRSGETAYPEISDFYKARPQKSVEIHLRSAAEMFSVPRENGLLRSLVFPTLSREQTFVLQATHLAKHLRSEWTRASWMLELYSAIAAHGSDSSFWQSVREQTAAEEKAVSIGIAALAAAKVFAFPLPPELTDWTADRLPEGVVRWVNEYAERSVTAQFPGSKLYLLLERELTTDKKRFRRQRRSVLLPFRLPGSIAASAGPRERIQTLPSHAHYLGFRLAFHVREGLRLLRAERDWVHRADGCDRCEVREGRSIA
jgi:hypothetical protein